MKKILKTLSENKLNLFIFAVTIFAWFFVDHATSAVTFAGMTVCGKLSKNLSPDCASPLHGGVDEELILINWYDIQNATIVRNGANPQIIENIILSSGALAYYFQGKNGSVSAKATLVVQKYAEVYDHEITACVFDVTASGKQQLEAGVQGRFVAIVQNKYKGSNQDCAFEVYGLDGGLRINALNREPNSADSQGAFMLTLKTDDKAIAYENHLPATFFKTDYATTKALVNALL